MRPAWVLSVRAFPWYGKFVSLTNTSDLALWRIVLIGVARHGGWGGGWQKNVPALSGHCPVAEQPVRVAPLPAFYHAHKGLHTAQVMRQTGWRAVIWQKAHQLVAAMAPRRAAAKLFAVEESAGLPRC